MMFNMGSSLASFSEAFDESIAGDMALSWIRSLTIEHERQEDIIRVFQDFWLRGIIIATEPQGKGITVREFKLLDDKEIEKLIMSYDDLSENKKYERIECYKKFKKWIKEPWKKPA